MYGAGATAVPGIDNCAHHPEHSGHDHLCGKDCGYEQVKHDDHVEFIHEGYRHHLHGGHWHECKVS